MQPFDQIIEILEKNKQELPIEYQELANALISFLKNLDKLEVKYVDTRHYHKGKVFKAGDYKLLAP